MLETGLVINYLSTASIIDKMHFSMYFPTYIQQFISVPKNFWIILPFSFNLISPGRHLSLKCRIFAFIFYPLVHGIY